MGPGSQHNMLDNHFGHHNWRKYVSLGKFHLFFIGLISKLILLQGQFYVPSFYWLSKNRFLTSSLALFRRVGRLILSSGWQWLLLGSKIQARQTLTFHSLLVSSHIWYCHVKMSLLLKWRKLNSTFLRWSTSNLRLSISSCSCPLPFWSTTTAAGQVWSTLKQGFREHSPSMHLRRFRLCNMVDYLSLAFATETFKAKTQLHKQQTPSTILRTSARHLLSNTVWHAKLCLSLLVQEIGRGSWRSWTMGI